MPGKQGVCVATLRLNGHSGRQLGSSPCQGLTRICRHTSAQQLFNLSFPGRVILVALDVLAARMDVPDGAVPIDEKTDAGPCARMAVQPPAMQRLPIRINGNRKFETKAS